jgi:hypothetical protein
MIRAFKTGFEIVAAASSRSLGAHESNLAEGRKPSGVVPGIWRSEIPDGLRPSATMTVARQPSESLLAGTKNVALAK